MTVFIKTLIIILLSSGLILCFYKMRKDSSFYKKGFIFFMLQLLSNIYTLLIPYYIDDLIKNRSDNIGTIIAGLNIPPLILTGISLVVLITIFTHKD